jgi:hypothetical protein
LWWFSILFSKKRSFRTCFCRSIYDETYWHSHANSFGIGGNSSEVEQQRKSIGNGTELKQQH